MTVSRCIVVLVMALIFPGETFRSAETVAFAGSATIRGRVIDQVGGALPGVSLTVMPQRAGNVVASIVSGRDGSFETSELPPGTYHVDARLVGFELIRVNNVRLGNVSPELTIVMPVGSVCQCVMLRLPPGQYGEIDGQVRDEAKQPIPFAKLELTSKEWRETALTSPEGRFRVRLRKDVASSLTITATGFHRATLKISGRSSSPIRITLKDDESVLMPTLQQLTDGCRCGVLLFMDPRR